MKKVAVWGKFDGLHAGHLEFLKNASKFGDKLYVCLMPDKVINEYGKNPRFSEEERKAALNNLEFIDEVFICSFKYNLDKILKLRPDVFVFGHDQKTVWEDKLKAYFSRRKINPNYVYLGIYNNGLHSSDLNSKFI